jgi:hypothetical protein
VSCGVCTDGEVICWDPSGYNRLLDREKEWPFAVHLRARAEEVASSGTGACVRFADGSVDCFTAYDTDRRPKPLAGAGTAARLLESEGLPCAIRGDGVALCWPEGTRGPELPGCPDHRRPCSLERLGPVRDLFETWGHGCAATRAGDVLCWGANFDGQASPSVVEKQVSLARVPGVSGAVAVSGASFPAGVGTDGYDETSGRSCAVTGDGRVICWGLWSFEEPRRSQRRVREVEGLRDVIDVAVSEQSACALHGDGRVSCWGPARGDGRALGDGPAFVYGLSDTIAIGAATGQMCALRRSGDVVCWGHGMVRGATDGMGVDAVAIPGLDGGRELAVGSRRACALDGQGRVWCWGGVLPPGPGAAASAGPEMTALPVRIFPEEQGFARVAVGGRVCAARLNEAWCSAEKGAEHLRLPAAVEQIESTWGSACARLAGGDLFCWGDNTLGRLGDGTMQAHEEPRRVLLPGPARRFGLDSEFGCAELADATVWCWGGYRWKTTPNTAERIVDATPRQELSIAGARGWTFDSFNICVLRADGITCTKLGEPASEPSFRVRHGADVEQLTGPPLCGLTARGQVECWISAGPELDGETLHRLPEVAGLAGSRGSNCARTWGGSVFCWGDLARQIQPLLPHPVPGLTRP